MEIILELSIFCPFPPSLFFFFCLNMGDMIPLHAYGQLSDDDHDDHVGEDNHHDDEESSRDAHHSDDYGDELGFKDFLLSHFRRGSIGDVRLPLPLRYQPLRYQPLR